MNIFERVVSALEERLQTELEFNPFSPASRAARAARAGRIAEALALYERARRYERVGALLGDLPDWPIRQALLRAADELRSIERAIELGERAGQPVPLASSVRAELRPVTQALWRCAGRVAAAARDGVAPDRLAGGLGLEHERLERLGDAIVELRARLAESRFLDDGAVADVEAGARRLRALSDAIREAEALR